ncbi:MAG: NADH-quinone oxidoreductase subunit M [Dehalococcoidia bacterium]|nr:NADH-quinone oxidoreductase subunit M [Chloroflexota bacterium]MCH2525462.1 NADH-quinone oxidoreductase subunit M [Dehalococcoidia bacterium]MQG00153.1 NADH-quinone oxidoreductase subunit M [SAR202 cluster bacterium]
MDNYLLISLILLPALAAIMVAFVPRQRLFEIRAISGIVAFALFVLSAYSFINYDNEVGGYQFTRDYAWLDALGIQLSMGIDGISTTMVLLTGIVSFTAVLISWNIEHRAKDFFVLFLLLVAGVYGVFVSLDLFFFFFFYELAVLPMYLLIGVWGSSSDFVTFIRNKEYGALKLMLYLVAGSILVWVALLAVYVEGDMNSFSLLKLQDAEFSEDFQRLYFPMFMVGFGVLAGLWPFHTWSPDGHVAAPTSVSMLHAGVLMKLGAYGIIRIGVDLLPQGAEYWMPLLMILGTINVVYGAVSALSQTDLKYVIGYSSVSHMGYVFMGLATLNATGMGGAVLQMFSHGIMTALFFALVGVIYDRSHVRDIGILEGLAKRMGWTASFFAIAGLASLGLPGLSGFVAEVLVFIGTFKDYPIFGVLGIIGAAITAVYILRLLGKVFFGPISEDWKTLPDASNVEKFSAGILVLFLLVVGLYPKPWMDLINTGLSPLIERVAGL